PRGFYDTSIDGDARFLGWHINSEYQSTRPTDFFPIGTYAKTMHQPEVLDRIWQRGELAQHQQQPEVYSDQPPRVVFTSLQGGARLPAPGVVWTVNVPNPRLGLSISAQGSSRITERHVIFDERLLELPPLGPPKPTFTENIQVELVPNRRVRLAVH